MFFEAADDIDIASQRRARPCIEHDIGGRKLRLMCSERFANETFDSIPSHSSRDDPRRNCQAESRMLELIWANQHSEQLTGVAARSSLAKYPVELGFAA
jgi:hypothetical protein